MLLVLAGIAIAMLTGDNGILKKAMSSRDETEASLDEEEEKLKISENILNTLTEGLGGVKDTVSPTSTITLESATLGVKATVRATDNNDFDEAKCKYVFTNSADKIGANVDLYTEGFIKKGTTIIQKAKLAGTYYLHVLLTDTQGNKEEYVSENSVTVADKIDYSYTGNAQTAKLMPGKYKLEVWGAQGGSYSSTYTGGHGGYSTGILNLDAEKNIYAYVGGVGTTVTTNTTSGGSGGFNGGASGGSGNSSYNYKGYGGSGGGGASDFRIENTSIYARLLVAGGGGGTYRI